MGLKERSTQLLQCEIRVLFHQLREEAFVWNQTTMAASARVQGRRKIVPLSQSVSISNRGGRRTQKATTDLTRRVPLLMKKFKAMANSR